MCHCLHWHWLLSQWQIALGVYFHVPYFLAKPAQSWPAFALHFFSLIYESARHKFSSMISLDKGSQHIT